MRVALWDEQVFFQQTINDFAFLVALGYKRPKKKIASNLYTLTYTSKISAVEITFDRREQHIDVYLTRLIDGNIPNRYSIIDGRVVTNLKDWMHLYDLLYVRSPEVVAGLAHGGASASAEDIQNIVAKHANTLLTWGQDIFRGDLSVFIEAERSKINRMQTLSISPG